LARCGEGKGMKAEMVLGGVLDVASTDEVQSIVDGAVRELRVPARRRAQRRTLVQSTQMPVAGFAVLDLGLVPEGAMWALVDCIVVGGDDHTTVTNASAALYAGGQAPNVGGPAPMLGNLLRPGTAVPAVWPLTKDLYLHTGDGLYVLVYGATAAVNLVAIARVYEWRPAGVEEADVL